MHVMQVAGAEVLVTQIIDKLRDRIEPTVFCLDKIGVLGVRLQEAGVPVILLDRNPGFDLQVAKRLSGEVKKRRIEVLHAHQYTPFFYSALARMLFRTPAKIIFTEHGRHYPDIVSSKRHWANRLLLQRYADITTACCRFSTHALQTNEGFPSAINLPNGVDLSNLSPRSDAESQHCLRNALGMDNDIPYVACIARFHKVKDHATLIRAWQIVHRQIPRAKLLLVGDGPERATIKQQIKELDSLHTDGNTSCAFGLSSSIEFWGVRSDVADILRAVDVFTLTSVSEASSLTLLEAMASECPVVITDVGGNAEHVTDGVEGRLVPRADHEQLGQCLSVLLRDSNQASVMGKAARQRVIKDFDLNKAIQSYCDHYVTLAKSKPK